VDLQIVTNFDSVSWLAMAVGRPVVEDGMISKLKVLGSIPVLGKICFFEPIETIEDFIWLPVTL
jgi:hypothetical protein